MGYRGPILRGRMRYIQAKTFLQKQLCTIISQGYTHLPRTHALSAPGAVNLWSIPLIPVYVSPGQTQQLRRRVRSSVAVVALVRFLHFDTIGVAVGIIHHRLQVEDLLLDFRACDSPTSHSPTTRSHPQTLGGPPCGRLWDIQFPLPSQPHQSQPFRQWRPR